MHHIKNCLLGLTAADNQRAEQTAVPMSDTGRSARASAALLHEPYSRLHWPPMPPALLVS